MLTMQKLVLLQILNGTCWSQNGKSILNFDTRFGFTLDLAELFQLPVTPDTMNALDLKSGREAADWVAFNLEEDERLVDHKSKQ